MDDLCTNIDRYYDEWIEPKFNKDGTEKKRRGKSLVRTINPSLHRLKILQKIINRLILKKLKYPEYIHGGIKKKSNITNSSAHVGREHKFTTDLRDFFPSIKSVDVYKMFIRYEFSPDVACKLTRLTTYKGSVPQGAPTSSFVANLTTRKANSTISRA